MAAAASAMVRRSLESFVRGAGELAQAVLQVDNVLIVWRKTKPSLLW